MLSNFNKYFINCFKNFLHELPKFSLAYVTTIVLFIICMLLASSFPSKWLDKNAKESAEILLEQTGFYFFPFNKDATESYSGNPFFEYLPNIRVNNYSDSVMINLAYSIDSENPFLSFMSSKKNYNKDFTTNSIYDTTQESKSILSGDIITMDSKYDPCQELYDFTNGTVHTSIEYARYWHGYLIYLRPLLIFYNITQIRHIQQVLLVCLFILFIYSIYVKLGRSYAFIFSLVLIMFDFFLLIYSLESTPAFAIMIIASLIVLWRSNKAKNLSLYFFIIGAVTNFFDFLTVPLITLAVPLIIHTILSQKNLDYSYKDSIKTIINASIAWFVGYALTWATKWVLFDISFDHSVILNAIMQIKYRTSSTNPLVNKTIWQTLFILLLPYISIYLLFVYAIIIEKNKKKFLKDNCPYLLLMFYPIIWYILLSNHTILHDFFVYRHLLITILCLIIMIKNIYTSMFIKKIPKLSDKTNI